LNSWDCNTNRNNSLPACREFSTQCVWRTILALFHLTGDPSPLATRYDPWKLNVPYSIVAVRQCTSAVEYLMINRLRRNRARERTDRQNHYQHVRTIMAMITRIKNAALTLCTLLNLAVLPARASLFSLAASGTISENSSGDSTIPFGTPWTFQIIYDTAAPDLDFEMSGSPDATFGRFTNTATPPALTFFRYRTGSYQVTLDDAADFGTFSEMLITFTSIKGIDINISAPVFFPPLAGGPSHSR
jgi:hypothetical protein